MRWVEKRMHATTYKNVMEKEMLPYAEENIPFCFIHYVPIKTPHRRCGKNFDLLIFTK
jgi:hypothetical protein